MQTAVDPHEDGTSSAKPNLNTSAKSQRRAAWFSESVLVLLLLASSVVTLSALVLPDWRFLEHWGFETAANGFSFRKIQISPWELCMTFDVTNASFEEMRGETCYPLRSEATLLIPSPDANMKTANSVATFVGTQETTICDHDGDYRALLKAMGMPQAGAEYTLSDAVEMLYFACGSGQQAAVVFHFFAALVALTSLAWALALIATSQLSTKSSLHAKLARKARITVPVWCGLGTGLFLWASAPGQGGVSIKLEIAAMVMLGLAAVVARSNGNAVNDKISETDTVNVTPRNSDPLV